MSASADIDGPIRDDAFGYALTMLGLGVIFTVAEYAGPAVVHGDWAYVVLAAAQAAAWAWLSRGRIKRARMPWLYLAPLPALVAKYYFVGFLSYGGISPTPSWLVPTLLGLLAVWLTWTLVTAFLAYVTRRPAP